MLLIIRVKAHMHLHPLTQDNRASLVAQMVKDPLAKQETLV